jgi:hypothetical protein
MTLGPWTEALFEEMSWHDNHVHALRIVEGEHGSGDLILDLDYILEWIQAPQGFQFKIVPVNLRFRGVTNLRIDLNYAEVTAAVGPFSIHRIERRKEVRDRYTAQCWEIDVNWPGGGLSFEATGYLQEAWGKVKVSERQHLMPGEREDA